MRNIVDYELISVDIWDTLLRRYCAPEQVKRKSCEFIYNHYGFYFNSDVVGTDWLYKQRILAEKFIVNEAFSKNNDFEYRLVEVILALFKKASNLKSDSQKIEEIVQEIAEYEFYLEMSVSYRDTGIEKLLSTFRGEKIFLSDFYLGKADLKYLLKAKGVYDEVNDGYVSCDSLFSKRSGQLYELVKKEKNPGSWLHIGDNKFSDGIQAKSRGVNSVLYRPFWAHIKRKLIERDIPYFPCKKRAIEKAISTLYGKNSAYNIGVKFSLVFFAFTLWLKGKLGQRPYKTVYFLTREGIFLKSVYDKMIECLGLSKYAVPSKILEVSRLSTFASSLFSLTPKALAHHWIQYERQTAEALLQSLNLSQERFSACLGDAKLPKPLESLSALELVQFIQSQHLLTKNIETFLSQTREEIFTYLSTDLSIIDEKAIAIVDIGWRGSIQDNLVKLLPAEVDGYYFGLIPFLSEQNIGAKSSFLPDLNITSDINKDRHWYNAMGLLEMVMNNHSGSVIGYRDGKAIKQELVGETRVFDEFTVHFQRGVLDAIPQIAKCSLQYAMLDDELIVLGKKNLDKMIHSPPSLLANYYLSLVHNETFGLGMHLSRSSVLPRHFRDICKTSSRQQIAKNIGWLEALAYSSSIKFFIKWTVRIYLKLKYLRRRVA